MFRAILNLLLLLTVLSSARAEVVGLSGSYTGFASNGDNLAATAVGQFDSSGTGLNWLELTFDASPSVDPEVLGLAVSWNLLLNAGEPVEPPYAETLWEVFRGTYAQGGFEFFESHLIDGTMVYSSTISVDARMYGPLLSYEDSIWSGYDQTHGWWDMYNWGTARFLSGDTVQTFGWFYPKPKLTFSFTGRLTEFDAEWTSPNVLHVTWRAEIPEPSSLVLLLASAGLLNVQRFGARSSRCR